MKLELLNKNKNEAIILAGICSLIIGIGMGRFAFTSLLPFMLTDFLDINLAGILASVNYTGYLSGSIFAIFIKNVYVKVKYFRIGLFLCVVTTVILGLTTNEMLWVFSRLVSGFAASMCLVVGSAIVMSKLNMQNKTKAMGIYFSGLGLSIVVSDLIMYSTIHFGGLLWSHAWLFLSLFALIASIYSAYILSFEKIPKTEIQQHKFDKSIFSPFVILLIVSYFTAGIGMVVQATFLPDIINNLKGLEGYGNLTWSLVGLAGIPSCIIWMTLANKFGSVKVIIIAMLIQVLGIAIPALSVNIYANLFSGFFYGITFVGLVALFMNLGGKIVKHNPVLLMASLTTAYGIGQVLAPLYSITFVKHYGSYDYALITTALIVFVGAMLLLYSKKFELKEFKCQL